MNKELETIEEKLDCVLDYYRIHRKYDPDAWNIVGEKVGVEINEVGILLTDENYIANRVDRGTPQLTVKGALFKGFVNEKTKAASLLQMQQADLKRRNLNDWLLVRASIMAAVSTTLILILEFVKYMKTNYPCCPTWFH